MSDQQQYANTANYSEHEESEVHVEIEHITGDDIDTGDTLNTNAVGQDELGQSLNGVVNVSGRVPAGKRTVILPYQRKILENFFMTGMNSASHPLRHLHEAAADQTGLELHVVKNWVRNRRRPAAVLRRPQESPLIVVTMGTPSIPSTSSITTVAPPAPVLTCPLIQTLSPQVQTMSPLPVLERKRHCFDRQAEGLCVPLTVKVRIADSDETDFVEVELESVSYANLVKLSCDELGVSLADVAKIRKLPNVLVRKDKDLIRMTEGQEIELVLKGSSIYMTNNALTCNFTPPNLINFSGTDMGMASLTDHHGNPVSN